MNLIIYNMFELFLRWLHLFVGIMWVGNSIFFNWLDRNLIRKDTETLDTGSVWFAHSGGFYCVEKKSFSECDFPQNLHWFKWQAYLTWISGFFLLFIVYYSKSESLFFDSSIVANFRPELLGIIAGAIIFITWFIYDKISIEFEGENVIKLLIMLAGFFCFVLFLLFFFLSGKAAFLHVGAIFGSIMAGNVFFHITPSQRQLILNNINTGSFSNDVLSFRAKQRSIHNNYLTFPVLFFMLSNHFSILYNNQLNWLIAVFIIITAISFRHVMNIRFEGCSKLKYYLLVFVISFFVVIYLSLCVNKRKINVLEYASKGLLLSESEKILKKRCLPCHSLHPDDKEYIVTPGGIRFDIPNALIIFGAQIYNRVVVLKSMPLNNKTRMTDKERDIIAAWWNAYKK